MRPSISALVVTLSVATSGCYTLTPVRVADVTPEQAVRVTVTPVRAAELEAALNGFRRSFNATFIGLSQGELMLQVSQRSQTAGMSHRGLANRLSIPEGDIVSLEARELSQGRTAALVGATAAVVTAVAVQVFGGSNKTDQENPDPIDEILIPVFSIPIGW